MSQAPTGDNARVIAPPPLLYALPLAAGLVAQHYRPVAVLPGPWAMPAGVMLCLLGLVGLPAVLAFRRAGTDVRPWKPATALVTDGVYRITRNPMYVGFTLVYLGISLWVNTLWPLALLPFVLVTMDLGVIRREEAYLERLFGEPYRAYRARVRRWL